MVVSETSAFLVPAPTMPVAPQVGCGLGDDDEMADARVDRAVASRAHVCLDGLVWLDRTHDLVIEA